MKNSQYLLAFLLSTLLFFTSTPIESYESSYQLNPSFSSSSSSLSNNSYSITLEPRYQTTLSAEVISVVKKISKRMGESFKKDDLLIEIKNTSFDAYYNRAQALLKKSLVDLESKKKLFNDGIISQFDLREAEALLAEANADLVMSKDRFDACSIKAPYSGKVVSLNIEEYEITQVGKELIEIIDDTVLIAKLLAHPNILKTIEIGKSVQITLSDSKEIIEGKIIRIGAVIDPSSSTIKIELEVDNIDDKLKAGMRGVTSFTPTKKHVSQ